MHSRARGEGGTVFLAVFLLVTERTCFCGVGEAHINDIFIVCVATVKTCVCLPLACPAELAAGAILGKESAEKG